MNRNEIGTTGVIISGIISLGMMVATLIMFPHEMSPGTTGICAPSPNQWVSRYPATWIVNTVLLFSCGVIMMLCNKRFNFVTGAGRMPIIMSFIVLCGGNPYITSRLCSSTLLCVVNLISLWFIFNTYGQRNSTQDYFLIATFLSLGSMFEYAFVAMVPVYLIGGLFLKSLRIKEGIAYLLGLIAPYWIGLGLGILSPADFHWPGISSVFVQHDPFGKLLIMLLATGVSFLICALLSMNNAVKLYAGNSRVRHINNIINLLGYISFLCIIIDYTNMTAYLATLFLWMSVQIGNMFALNRFRNPAITMWIAGLLYIGQYIFQII